jgi:hypothetical protein
MLRPMRALFVICLVGAAGVVGASSSIADTGPGTEQTSTAPTVPRTTPTSTVAPTPTINPVVSAAVNAYPHGMWPTAALAAAHGSNAVGPADSHGCPSYDGCGWVNSNFGLDGGIFNQDSNFTTAYEPECNIIPAYQDWNDCVSSIDNTETTGCYETWFWNTNYGSTRWVEAPGVAHGNLGSSNDEFSSSKYCTNSAGN